MGYCTIEDVEAKGTHHGKAYDETTRPTASRVQWIINRVSLEMDARMKIVGVKVPVDPVASPMAAAILNDICATGVAAEAQRSAFLRANPNASPASDVLQKLFEAKMLYLVGDGTKANPGNPAVLADAAFTALKPAWPRGGGLYSRLAQLPPPPYPDRRLEQRPPEASTIGDFYMMWEAVWDHWPGEPY